MSEWKTIDSAPNDGSVYLAYSAKYANHYWITDKSNGMTHWMPLPQSPGANDD